MDALELVTRTSAPINGAGAAFYFDGATLAAGDALGLDAFHFYSIGRGGVLGDVEPAVVASAFGYFYPAVVDQLWTEGRAIIAPRDAATAYLTAANEFGRSKLADADQAALRAADVRPDELLSAWYGVLDDSQRTAFADGADAIAAALGV